MYLVDNLENHDPTMNLALEEFLMRRFRGGETLLLLYVNDPTVVIGRNQVPFAEVGLQEVRRRQTAVVRRISGGGTVYHGPGNLNFGLIQARRADPFPSPSQAVRPVLNALQALGMPARPNDRHDILLEGRKITGTAQYRTQDRCLTHGTLLVSADLDALQQLLTPDCQLLAFRGRSSLRSTVTNLARHRTGLTLEVVRDELIRAFAADHGRAAPLALASADWVTIRQAARTKYRSWELNVGRSPEFTIRRCADLPWGPCEAVIQVQHGHMTHVAMALPADAPPGVARWAVRLEGERYHPRIVAQSICAAGSDRDLPASRHALAEWICPEWFWWN